jgi:hypothetical protein
MTLSDPVLAGLVDLARARPDGDFFDALDLLGRHRRAEAWEIYWAAWSARNDKASALLQRWNALPAERRAPMLAAPEMYSLLHGAALNRQGYSLGLMESWIAAEERRAGNLTVAAAWSVRGDFDGTRERGVLLPCGTLLDCASPATTAALAEIPGDAIPWNHAQASAIEARLREAMAGLQRGSSFWFEALARFVSVIVTRNDPALDQTTSSTTRLALGRIVLRNAHRADDPWMLAEGLVHETMHILFDHAELAAPLLPDADPAATAISPWSGRALDLNTFVQACFVWCAVFGMWRAALTAGLVSNERAARALRRSGSGFAAAPSPQALLARHDGIPRSVIGAVAILCDDVLVHQRHRWR